MLMLFETLNNYHIQSLIINEIIKMYLLFNSWYDLPIFIPLSAFYL